MLLCAPPSSASLIGAPLSDAHRNIGQFQSRRYTANRRAPRGQRCSINASARNALRCWIGSIAKANGVVKMRMPRPGGFLLARFPPSQGRAVPRNCAAKTTWLTARPNNWDVTGSVSHAATPGPTTGPSGATCIPLCLMPHGQLRHNDIKRWSHDGKRIRGCAVMPVMPTRPRSCLWAICVHRAPAGDDVLAARGRTG